MFNQVKAQIRLQEALPGWPIKFWAEYGDLFLFRVVRPEVDEEHWDPFFSVDNLTGEVSEFSVLADGDLTEITNLKWNEL